MSVLNVKDNTWNEFINQVEAGEEISGGADGNANIATRQLAENIFFIKRKMYELAQNKNDSLSESQRTEFTNLINDRIDAVRNLISEYKDLTDSEVQQVITMIQDEVNVSLEKIDEAVKDNATKSNELSERIDNEISTALDGFQDAINAIEASDVAVEETIRTVLGARYEGDKSPLEMTLALLLQEETVRAEEDLAQAKRINILQSSIGGEYEAFKTWKYYEDPEDWVGGIYQPEEYSLKVLNAELVSPLFVVDGGKFNHVKLRIKRVGEPTWKGKVLWNGRSETEFKDIEEPLDWSNGNFITLNIDLATEWRQVTINNIYFQLTDDADANNYFIIDWISIGRNTPGISTAQIATIENTVTELDSAIAERLTTIESDLVIPGVGYGEGSYNEWIASTIGPEGAQTKQLETLNSKWEGAEGFESVVDIINNLETKTTADEARALSNETITAKFGNLTQDDLTPIVDSYGEYVDKVDIVAAAEKATAEKLEGLSVKYNESSVDFNNRLTILADENESTATQVSSLTARTDGVEGSISSLEEVITNADGTGLAQRMDNLELDIDGEEGINARITSLDKIVSDNNTTTVQKLSDLDLSREGLESSITSLESIVDLENENSVITSRFNSIDSKVGKNSGSIDSLERIVDMGNEDSVIVTKFNDINAKTDSAIGSITKLEEVVVGPNNSIVTQISNLDGRTAATEGSISELRETTNTLTTSITENNREISSRFNIIEDIEIVPGYSSDPEYYKNRWADILKRRVFDNEEDLRNYKADLNGTDLGKSKEIKKASDLGIDTHTGSVYLETSVPSDDELISEMVVDEDGNVIEPAVYEYRIDNTKNVEQIAYTDTDRVFTRNSVNDNTWSAWFEIIDTSEYEELLKVAKAILYGTAANTNSVISVKEKTYADMETAMSEIVTGIESEVDGNTANIDTIIKTYATKDYVGGEITSEIDNKFKTVDGVVTGSLALELKKAWSDDFASTSEKLENFVADYDGNIADVIQSVKAYADTDSSSAQKLDSLTANFGSTNLAEFESDIKLYADEQSSSAQKIDSLTSEWDGKTLAEFESSIKTYADEESASAQKLDTLTAGFGDKTLSDFESEIKLYADEESTSAKKIDALTAGYDGRTLAEFESDIKIYADSDKASASSLNTLTAEFNNLEIGGANLLVGSDFSNPGKWGGDKLDLQSFNRFGIPAIRGTLLSDINAQIYGITTNNSTSIVEGKYYVLTFYAKSNISGLNIIELMRSDGPNKRLHNVVFFNEDDTHVQVIFKAPWTSTKAYIGFLTNVDAKKDDYFEIWSAKLEKGNKATDWSPNYSDTGAANKASIKSESKVLADADKAITERIDTFTAGFGDKSLSKVIDEVKTYADEDSASAQKIENFVADYDGNIADVIQSVKTYADKDSTSAKKLETLTAGFDKNLADFETDIKTYVDKDSASAQKLEVLNAEFNNLEIGGRNLIRNSHNPSDLSEWDRTENTEIRTHGWFYNNEKTLFTLTNTTTSEVIVQTTRFFVERNTDYTLSFTGIAARNVKDMDVWFLGRLNGETDAFTNSLAVVNRKRLPAAGGSERVVVTFNSGAADEAYLRFDNNGSTDGATAGLYFGEIKLEKGTKATDWTPAPEDIEGALETNKSAITQEAEARADGDKALTKRIDTFTSGFGDKSLSKVIDEVKTYADKDKASASSLNTLTTEFNNLEIGGRNLLLQTRTLEDQDTMLETSPMGSMPGVNVVYVNSNQSEEQFITLYRQNVQVPVGDTEHVFSCYLWTGGNNTTFQLIFNPLGTEGQNTIEAIGSQGQVKTVGRDGLLEFNVASTKPTRVWVKWKSNADEAGSKLIWVRVVKDGAALHNAMAKPKLEKGNKATDWTPAPEDIDAVITSNKASIESESKVRADGDKAITERIDTFTAGFGDKSLSKVINEVKTYADKESASAKKIDALTAGFDGRTLADFESDIKIYADADKASASNLNNLTVEFNNLEIGGRNLLRGTTDYELINSRVGRGTEVLPEDMRPEGTFKPNTTYTLSFLGKRTDNTLRVSNNVYFLNVNGNGHRLTAIEYTTEYKQHIFTFTTPSEVGTGATIRFDNWGSSDSNAATISAKEIKLEKGNKATDWTPAPEDIDAAITANKATIKRFDEAKAGKDEVVTIARENLSSEWTGYADDKINNLEIGARNLLLNTGNLSSKLGGGTTQNLTSHLNNGNDDNLKQLYLDKNNPQNDKYYIYVQDTETLIGGDYIFSFDLWTGGAPSTFNIWVSKVDATNDIIDASNSDGQSTNRTDGYLSISLATNAPQRCWHRFKIPKNTKAKYRIYVRLDINQFAAGSNFFALPALGRGTKAADWTPAPEDLQSKIDSKPVKVDVLYYLSSSATSLTGGTWQTTAPTWVDGKYMWSKTVTYDAGDQVVSESKAVNISGAKGSTGATGPRGPQGIQGPQGIPGLEGPKGNQGIQGPKGADGKSSYTHVAYATNASGTGFKVAHFPAATYIGMYVDNKPEDEAKDPSKYKWSLIKGADGANGTPGKAGADGKTPYLHIAYATNSTGTSGFSTTVSTGKTYIGQYTDNKPEDEAKDPSKYKWSLIKGETGDKGATGSTGQGVESIVEQYAISSSKTNAPRADGWSTTPPTWESGKYLWTRSVITYKNPREVVETTPVCDTSWEAVNEIEIGGRNLLPDTRLLGKPEDYSEKFNGFNVVTAESTGDIPTATYISMTVPATENEYVLSFWAKGNKNLDARFYFYGPNTVISGESSTGQTSGDSNGQIFVSVTTEWKKYWIKWKQTPTDEPKRLALGRIYNDAEKIYLAGFMLQSGNKATDWSPAPEDAETAIISAKATIDRFDETKANKNEVSSIVREEISSEWKSYADDKVDGLEIGGRNLIRNSHNPSDFSEWTGGISNASIATHPWFYNKAKTLFKLFNESTDEVVMSTARFFVERNTDYTLSFTGFADSNVRDMDVFFLGRLNGETSGHTRVVRPVNSKRLPAGGGAERVVVTFNSGAADEAYLRFDNNGSTNGNKASLYFGEIKLEKGTKATDWTPAPEDTYSAITANKATIERFDETKANKNEVVAMAREELESEWRGYADDLEIGGANILVGSDFSNPPKWGGNKLDLHSFDRFGIPAIRGTLLSDITGEIYGFATNNSTLIGEGNNYVLSFYIKSSISAFNIIELMRSDGSNHRLKADLTITGAGSKYVVIKFKAPWTSPKAYIGFLTNVDGKKDDQFEIWGVKLEKGTKATDWTPTYTDVNSPIVSAKADIKRIDETKANKNDVVAIAREQLESEWRGDIDAVEVGARNLLLKTGDLSSIRVGGKIQKLVSHLNNGNDDNLKQLYMDKNNMPNAWDLIYEQDTETLIGGDYVFSFDLWTGGAPSTFNIWFTKIGANNDVIEASNSDGLSTTRSDGRLNTSVATNAPQRCWHRFKIPKNTKSKYRIHVRLDMNEHAASGNYFALPALGRGNKAADWTPAPEDTGAAIAANKATIERFDEAKANKNEVVSIAREKLESEWTGYADDKVDNLEIVGRNLIRNSHNPSDFSDWNGQLGRADIVTHGWFYNNAKTLFRVTSTTTDETSIGTERFSVERNTDYTLSFTGFAASNVRDMDVLFLGRQNGETDGVTNVVYIINNKPIRGRERVVVTFNSGPSDEAYLRFDNNGSTNGNSAGLWFGEIKLEKGTKATAWVPAYEDGKASIEEIKEVVAGKNGLTSKWSLKLDVNNNISGIEQNNDGASSEFKILADDFKVVNSAGQGGYPFRVSGNTVYADDLQVKNANIDNLAVNTIKIADNAVTVPRHVYNSNIISGIQGGRITKEICRATVNVEGGATSITVSIDKAHARASAAAGASRAEVTISVSILGGESLRSYLVANSTSVFEDVKNENITLPPILDKGRKGNVTYVVNMTAYSATNSDNIMSVTGTTLQILGVKK